MYQEHEASLIVKVNSLQNMNSKLGETLDKLTGKKVFKERPKE
jgi:hypothetical protein